MIVHNVQQGSPQWLALRSGTISASELDSLVTPLGKIRTGDGVSTYIALKLAERWLGAPLRSWRPSAEMEQGTILEDEAIPYLEWTLELTIQRVGFVTRDDGSCGCSPDGLLPDGAGCEIKSPQPAAHVTYLLGGELPSEHVAQVQGGMYVTGASRWLFASYCRGFPAFVRWVARDEKYIASIDAAVDAANTRISVGYQHLIGLNGGPPVRPPTEAQLDAQFMEQFA